MKLGKIIYFLFLLGFALGSTVKMVKSKDFKKNKEINKNKFSKYLFIFGLLLCSFLFCPFFIGAKLGNILIINNGESK